MTTQTTTAVRGGVFAVAALVAAGCASGDSILNAGNDGTRPPTPRTTAAPGAVGPGTTLSLTGRAVPTTIDLTGAAPSPAAATMPLAATTIPLGGPSGPSGFAGAAGSARPLPATAPVGYAPCPVSALDERDPAAGPVRITFWHTMTNVLEESLVALTDAYNASQDRVVVELSNQNGYEQVIDTYFQSGHADRPHLVQMPDYMVQQMADANTVVPSGACIQTENYDISALLPRALLQYQTGGVQWSMPFNVSNPVLYYNRVMFEEAGLDPDDPPLTLEELREFSEALVDSGAATFGWAVDTGIDSGGGWFLEQWFARAGLPYSDNGNGRGARSTEVLFNVPEAVDMLGFVQEMVLDGLAVNVGDNPGAQDVLLKLADPEQPAAMGITTSAGLGTVMTVLDGGLIPGLTSDDIGIGPMPGPTDTPSAIVGGASLYIVRDKGDAESAAAWDYIKYLISAESQSEWAATTGYVPVNVDAVELDPLAATYAADPRFRVAYDQVLAGADDFASVGPVLGPMREIRSVTAQMMAHIYDGTAVEDALAAATEQANLLIIDYANRN